MRVDGAHVDIVDRKVLGCDGQGHCPLFAGRKGYSTEATQFTHRHHDGSAHPMNVQLYHLILVMGKSNLHHFLGTWKSLQIFAREKDKNTLFYLRNISGNRGITFLAEHQLRTYDTLIDSIRLSRKDEKFPELKYRIIGEPLQNGRFNLTSETSLVYQNRVFDRLSPTNRSFDGTSSSKAQTDFLGRGELLTAERVFDRSSARFDPKETIRFDTFNYNVRHNTIIST